MEHLIDKSALVAEIEKRKKEAESNCGGYKSYDEHRCNACIVGFYEEFLEIINTLDVKEVDLDVMQRMEGCPYRQVGCIMYEGHILECKGACSWVVDYPKLKEFKAQKGE